MSDNKTLKSEIQEWQIDSHLSLKSCSKGLCFILKSSKSDKVKKFKTSVRQAEKITEILSMIYPNSVYKHWDNQK